MSNTTGLRAMLIAADEDRRERWRRGPHPGWPEDTNWELPFDDGDRALRAGEPVVLWSSELFDALFYAGQPTEGWRHGEVNAVKRWLLDQRDRLTEYVDEPQ